jgi:hypothetical protein
MFVRAALDNPSTRRLCCEYQIRTRDLCLACTELIDALPQDLLPQMTRSFSGGGRTREFLGEIHRATAGQTDLQHRLAIVACAKHRAESIIGGAPKKEPVKEVTRKQMLDATIVSKLPIILLCAVVIVAGLLLAIYLL